MDYFEAQQSLDDAKQRLRHSVTLTQQETAFARFGRLAAHKRYLAEGLIDHCAEEGCKMPIADLDIELMELARHLRSINSEGSGGAEGAA